MQSLLRQIAILDFTWQKRGKNVIEKWIDHMTIYFIVWDKEIIHLFCLWWDTTSNYLILVLGKHELGGFLEA